MPRPFPTRRQFLLTAGGAAVVGGVAVERVLRGGPHTGVEALADALKDVPDVRELGSEYLAGSPEEKDEGTLGARLGNVLQAGRGDTVATLASRFQELVAREFEAGETTLVGGWSLAKSELALYALAALRSSEGARPTALFAPEPEGFLDPEQRNDRRICWMLPEASFPVPTGTTQVDLEVRSSAPPQEFSAQCDGHAAGKISLADQEWQPFTVQLPPAPANGQYFVISLAVEPYWRPSGRGRALGVQIVENRWIR
ncbi:MAG TPA: hypothetical protein VIL35_12415 [Vicinamibacterales bacterium]